MASGTPATTEEPLRHRWSENRLVYTRKSFRGNRNNTNKNNTPISSEATTIPSASQTAPPSPNKQPNENNNNNNHHPDDSSAEATATATVPASQPGDVNKDCKSSDLVAEDVANDGKSSDHAAHESSPQENDNDIGKEVVQQKSASSPAEVPVEEANSSQLQLISSRLDSSPPQVPAEDANSSQPQLNLTHLESASEDSSILNRVEPPPVPNGRDAGLVNGGLVKPMVTLVDDRVNISVSAGSSKEAVRELKRKLEVELNQVRKMAKRLEDKEVQIGGFSSGAMDVGVGDVDMGAIAPAVSSFQFPTNGALGKGFSGGGRIHTDVGSNGSRFRQLSVSVMENNHGIGEVMEKEKRTPKANQYYRNSEFLLGKDRLPPAESNKKSKSSSKKHRSREVDYGFGIDKQLYKKCSNLLQKLMRHKLGWVFNAPVDVKKLGLHDYFDIIKHPMDLGTVKSRLTKNWYKTPREFAEDVRLTFHNAMTYNPEGQDVHFMAKELLGIFEERWPAIETEYDRKLRYEVIRDLGVPTPTSTKSSAPAHVYPPLPLSPPPLLHHPTTFHEARSFGRSQSMPIAPESRSMPAYIGGRTPAPKKPKAKDPDKRDMTFEEKQKLSTNLQSLPAEKLDAIVQIIKKRNTALSQHDDEIEVDIDSVDTETLWELDRFVTNYKKNLSKHKRKAERAAALQARALAAQTAQQTIPAPIQVEAVQETREGEPNITTSPHDKQEKHSDNASGSSSSSSSSSDSGSSSSDSDSSSSSSSGSDGGQ